MTSYELLYKHPYEGKGNDPESPEFIVRIYPDQFEQWKKDQNSIPLVEVVDAFEVYICYPQAHTGVFERPNNSLLLQVFESIDFEEIFNFMAINGHFRSAGKHSNFK